jgi:transposase InsO family protein
MKLNMKDVRCTSIPQLQKFMATSEQYGITIARADAYPWITATLTDIRYRKCTKHERGIVLTYIRMVTGFSPRQVKRLVAQWERTTTLTRKPYRRHRFNGKYTREDVILLARVDEAHDVLSGPAIRKILEREYVLYGRSEFARLASISVSHIYNLRKQFVYHQHVAVFTKTKGPKNTLGVRRKPKPNGRPGFIRVDSVHQGDSPNGEKGVYHINFVDEVTQEEFVACVSTICDRDMLPVIERTLDAFPFVVQEFHADNGSEYINHQVVALCNRLLVMLSKSRPRQHNDNALVETKNGSIIRKEMGYAHIPRQYAVLINTWYQEWFNVYLNFHRPCGFATATTDHKGKERKIYKPKDYMTPYQKFKSLPNAEQYLKPGVTFAQLNAIEEAMSDTEFATAMRNKKYKLSAQLAAHEAKELPMV